jgi:hypothetical protein
VVHQTSADAWTLCRHADRTAAADEAVAGAWRMDGTPMHLHGAVTSITDRCEIVAEGVETNHG